MICLIQTDRLIPTVFDVCLLNSHFASFIEGVLGGKCLAGTADRLTCLRFEGEFQPARADESSTLSPNLTDRSYDHAHDQAYDKSADSRD